MAYIYLYPPERYTTTSVNRTFPEHHWPLENTRHKVGDAFHDFFRPYEQDIRTPHTDIRETVKKYYMEIELPGLNSKADYSLKWTGSRTLLVQAEIKRPEVEEELALPPSESPVSPESDPQQKPIHTVHFLTRERRIGTYARAFYFYADVDHDLLEAKLQHGILHIAVPKKEAEQKEAKHVEVKHGES
jgi:HSP20 family protein